MESPSKGREDPKSPWSRLERRWEKLGEDKSPNVESRGRSNGLIPRGPDLSGEETELVRWNPYQTCPVRTGLGR
jgi:hypothetical protein